MPIEITELHNYIGRNGTFDGEQCVVGCRLKPPYREEPKGVLQRLGRFLDGVPGYTPPSSDVRFWGKEDIDPENVDEYVVTVGSKINARMVGLRPENVGKLEIG